MIPFASYESLLLQLQRLLREGPSAAEALRLPIVTRLPCGLWYAPGACTGTFLLVSSDMPAFSKRW